MFSGSVDKVERFLGIPLSTPFNWMLCQECPGSVDI
jgi:hypothetical protein